MHTKHFQVEQLWLYTIQLHIYISMIYSVIHILALDFVFYLFQFLMIILIDVLFLIKYKAF